MIQKTINPLLLLLLFYIFLPNKYNKTKIRVTIEYKNLYRCGKEVLRMYVSELISKVDFPAESVKINFLL